MTRNRIATTLAVLVLLAMAAGHADEQQMRDDWAAMHGAKAPELEAFNEAKFGMFIHWGLYAIPAGTCQRL